MPMVDLSCITCNKKRLQSEKRSNNFISSSLQKGGIENGREGKEVTWIFSLIGANKRNDQWIVC